MKTYASLADAINKFKEMILDPKQQVIDDPRTLEEKLKQFHELVTEPSTRAGVLERLKEVYTPLKTANVLQKIKDLFKKEVDPKIKKVLGILTDLVTIDPALTDNLIRELKTPLRTADAIPESWAADKFKTKELSPKTLGLFSKGIQELLKAVDQYIKSHGDLNHMQEQAVLSFESKLKAFNEQISEGVRKFQKNDTPVTLESKDQLDLINSLEKVVKGDALMDQLQKLFREEFAGLRPVRQTKAGLLRKLAAIIQTIDVTARPQ